MKLKSALGAFLLIILLAISVLSNADTPPANTIPVIGLKANYEDIDHALDIELHWIDSLGDTSYIETGVSFTSTWQETDPVDLSNISGSTWGGYIAAGRGSGQGLLIRYAPELGIESGDVSPAVKITSVSPNPFSSSLRITCSLPSPMSASITVYDLDGRIVDVVETGAFPAGEHTVSWIPSSELASGCYLIRLQTDAGTDVMNCVLLEN